MRNNRSSSDRSVTKYRKPMGKMGLKGKVIETNGMMLIMQSMDPIRSYTPSLVRINNCWPGRETRMGRRMGCLKNEDGEGGWIASSILCTK